MNRHLVRAIVVCLVGTASVRADEVIPWPAADQLPAAAKLLPAGQVSAEAVIQVTGPSEVPITILEIPAPKVTSHQYVLRAKVKYENVSQTSYVEMWNHFPGGMQAFSRTLGNWGPMAKIEGTQETWRDIALPFTSEPGKLPTKLVVNVVVPGKGVIYLTPFTLSDGPLSASPGEWWSEPAAGLVGGLGGGTIGLIGALIGVLAGFGKARNLVVSLCLAVIAVGATSLVMGIVAVILGQPWHVYYPLLLAGVIAVTVCGANLPTIRRRYDALELRRMSALDV